MAYKYAPIKVPDELHILFTNSSRNNDPIELEEEEYYDKTVKVARKWARSRNMGVRTDRSSLKIWFEPKRVYSSRA